MTDMEKQGKLKSTIYRPVEAPVFYNPEESLESRKRKFHQVIDQVEEEDEKQIQEALKRVENLRKKVRIMQMRSRKKKRIMKEESEKRLERMRRRMTEIEQRKQLLQPIREYLDTLDGVHACSICNEVVISTDPESSSFLRMITLPCDDTHKLCWSCFTQLFKIGRPTQEARQKHIWIACPLCRAVTSAVFPLDRKIYVTGTEKVFDHGGKFFGEDDLSQIDDGCGSASKTLLFKPPEKFQVYTKRNNDDINLDVSLRQMLHDDDDDGDEIYNAILSDISDREEASDDDDYVPAGNANATVELIDPDFVQPTVRRSTRERRPRRLFQT